MSITGSSENNFTRVGSSIGDITAGLYCVIGILAALHERNKTNLGKKIDISMLDCQVAILENAITRIQYQKKYHILLEQIIQVFHRLVHLKLRIPL